MRKFTGEELAFVSKFKIDEARVSAGSSFLQQGQNNEFLYTVLHGWAFRYKTLDDGRRQILNYALSGDMVGLQGALMQEMEHSVEALTDVVLCVFSRTKMWDLYRGFPSLAFDVTWLAAREEQFVDENLVNLGRRTATERTAYLLLHLYSRAEEAGLTNGGKTVRLPLTQQHLADSLGMSLVHTNKTLRKIAASGVFLWKDRMFEMRDRDALAAIAGEGVIERRPRPFI